MEDHRSDVTALVGLDEFVVTGGWLLGGQWTLWIERRPLAPVGCPACGTKAWRHDTRRHVVRDLPISGVPVRLVWRKQLWRCPDPDCPLGCFADVSHEIDERAVLTERARTHIARRVGPGGQSVAALAGELGVSWWAAMDAVRDHARARASHVTALGAPRAIGLDETSFLAATPTSPTIYVTHVVNLDTGDTIDVLEGRSRNAVATWLESKPQAWRDGIDHVVIDPHQPYAAAVRRWLPDAKIVVDHFHLIRLANQVLDEVRRRVQQDTLGHRGHRDDPLYRIRRRLLCGHERLAESGFDRVLAWLDRGDPDGEVSAAYLAKELLRHVYGATNAMHARRRLVIFYQHVADVDVPELTRLATTIERWQPELLRWHLTGLSNGPVEGTNLVVKNTKRSGFGFRNFDNYRHRVLLRCGHRWQPVSTPPLHPAPTAVA